MLFDPSRRPGLIRRVLALLASRRTRTDAADLAYLERMSSERLERDLGLIRHTDRNYRPY